MSGRKCDDNEGSGPRPPVLGKECLRNMNESDSECQKVSPPSMAHLNWARSLSYLLDDPDGVELLMKYVMENAKMYKDHVTFYFALEGAKRADPKTILQRIIAIYNSLVRRSTITIDKDLRDTLEAGRKGKLTLSPTVFDGVQQQVYNIIQSRIYPSFLTSQLYINYIQQMSVAQERFGGGVGAIGFAMPGPPPPLPPMPSSSSRSGSSTSGTVPPGGSSSAAGSIYGPSTSASSSESASATDTLPRSLTLPTLHEDSELSLSQDFEHLHTGAETTMAANSFSYRLTNDLLLATQTRRLEIRPSGAHGYVHPANFAYTEHTSYVPNSRVDSERASVSSGGDSMSLSSCSLDGRANVQRRHNSSESKAIRQSAITNKEIMPNKHVIPRTQRMHTPLLTVDQLMAGVVKKLETVKRQQEMTERTREIFGEEERDRAFAEAIRDRLALDNDNDQDILDQHVSRVWQDQTPHRSPRTSSPCPPLQPRRRQTSHEAGMLGEAGATSSGNSMRHSRSMPEHSSSRKLTTKWPSVYTDSGISMTSTDTLNKYKDTGHSSRSGSSTVSQLDEAKRRLEDETRRSRRYSQQHPPPLPGQSISSSSSGSSSLHQLAPPPLPARPQETTVVYTFCDESVPYRTKIPGTQPTLRQFKELLPKKGNFRFFFKTYCDDPECPVIQEEISNDADILPLFEGKVMGLVKPTD